MESTREICLSTKIFFIIASGVEGFVTVIVSMLQLSNSLRKTEIFPLLFISASFRVPEQQQAAVRISVSGATVGKHHLDITATANSSYPCCHQMLRLVSLVDTGHWRIWAQSGPTQAQTPTPQVIESRNLSHLCHTQTEARVIINCDSCQLYFNLIIMSMRRYFTVPGEALLLFK